MERGEKPKTASFLMGKGNCPLFSDEIYEGAVQEIKTCGNKTPPLSAFCSHAKTVPTPGGDPLRGGDPYQFSILLVEESLW